MAHAQFSTTPNPAANRPYSGSKVTLLSQSFQTTAPKCSAGPTFCLSFPLGFLHGGALVS